MQNQHAKVNKGLVPKIVYLYVNESVLSSLVKDIITFGFLCFSIWFSGGSKFWNFICFMMLFLYLLKFKGSKDVHVFNSIEKLEDFIKTTKEQTK